MSAKAWRREIDELRRVLRACGLEEATKWGKPCFVHGGKNVAIIQPFKPHCALMFFKGALLDDTHGLLRRQGANSQAARRLEFTSVAQIDEDAVRSYVEQAIALEDEGREVAFDAKHDLVCPEELTHRLEDDAELAAAFDALTPGRRRGYVLHIQGAKQSKTRAARVARCIPKILAGKGYDGR